MKKNKGLKTFLAGLILLILAVALGSHLYNLQNPAIRIYFIKGEKIIAVSRPLKGKDPLVAAARELMLGPNKEEARSGIFTEIPKKARIIKIIKENSTAVLSFSKELEEYGGGSARVQGLVAQIVYTFTEIPGINKVKILVGKKSGAVLGGEGFVIDQPLSREDLR